ncbi:MULTISPECIES: hypothetical protein [unclassified Variovorax]|uniref:hypothetical protein n=1 Tax=unclassified Variovorax TaxID=663243 RepID=UPI00076C5610|nr:MULTISPECIES: hypothetical protein [unclassified Variovorax]KWT87424.1 hypothetical protein APY03_3712 [Variovorax sp. WDL1]PNG45925.1 hypothetical protein CHC06_07903 [Variovorax sp. B2]PNG46189.1 hypothetical protein CHC07_07937 [Variovorax sp. B4]VTV19281.1 hypothetical protein WDL1P3_00203 [Variovorax sp. WDL1]
MNYEVDFLPVGEGSGDAIVIRYGDDTNGYLLHVVDGGRTETANTIIRHINRYYPGYFVNHMVLSHADNGSCDRAHWRDGAFPRR